MSRNPLINAGAAGLYIVFIASVMFNIIERSAPAKGVLAPIAVISIFTLSAAVMGYIFLSQPLQLYLDGKKKDALRFFLHTVLAFAGITLLILLTTLSGFIS